MISFGDAFLCFKESGKESQMMAKLMKMVEGEMRRVTYITRRGDRR